MSKWHDARNCRLATDALEVLVAKNYSTLALPCAAIYPVMKQGKFTGFKVAAPDGPLKNYFSQDDTKNIFFHLIQDACVDALTKKEEKRKGNSVDASSSVVKATAFREPPRPVFVMTRKELEAYFSNLKSLLAEEDGVKIKRKWPKLVNGKVSEQPTIVPGLDEICESILPSAEFVPAQKFLLGNVHWRLMLVCAYIILKDGKNPDTFAQEIPDDYKPRSFKLKDLKEFSKNVDASATKHDQKQRKKKSDENRGYVPFYEDESDHFDYDASSSDESESSKPPTALDYRPSLSRDTIAATQKRTSSALDYRQSLSSDTVAEAHKRTSSALDYRPSMTQQAAPTQPLKRPRSPSPTAGSSRSSARMPDPCPSASRTEPYVLRDPKKNPKKKPCTSVFEGMVPVMMPAPENMFYNVNEFDLDVSRTTGTPDGSVDGDDDPFQPTFVPVLKSRKKIMFRHLLTIEFLFI